MCKDAQSPSQSRRNLKKNADGVETADGNRPLSGLFLIRQFPAIVLISAVRCYQKCVSPLLGRNCRFYPSCSQYFILSVKKYGAISGAVRGLRRILRCHPWNAGGIDFP